MHVEAKKQRRLYSKLYQICLASFCSRTIGLLNWREMVFIVSVDLGKVFDIILLYFLINKIQK